MTKSSTTKSRPRKHANADLQVGEAFYGGVLSKLLFGMAIGKKTSLALLTAYSDKRALYEVEGNRQKVYLLLKYVAQPRHGKRGGISWGFNLAPRELGWIFAGLAPCASHFSLTEKDFYEIARLLGYTDEKSLAQDDPEELHPLPTSEADEDLSEDSEEEVIETAKADSPPASLKDCKTPIRLGLVCGHTSVVNGVKGVHTKEPTPICLLKGKELGAILKYLLSTYGKALPANLRLGLTVRLATRKGQAKMEVVFGKRPNRVKLVVSRSALLSLAKEL